MAWIQRPLPSMIPAWGPPISLSALQVIRSAPAATDSASVGSFSKPNREKSISGPAPTSSMTVRPRARPRRTSSSKGTSAVKPTIL